MVPSDIVIAESPIFPHQPLRVSPQPRTLTWKNGTVPSSTAEGTKEAQSSIKVPRRERMFFCSVVPQKIDLENDGKIWGNKKSDLGFP